LTASISDFCATAGVLIAIRVRMTANLRMSPLHPALDCLHDGRTAITIRNGHAHHRQRYLSLADL
jgi:hypothetical protein